MKEAAVLEAVVLAREDSPGDKRLVAYIVPEHERHPSGEDAEGQLIAGLRSRLTEQMPDYMCPGVYVILDTLPLTPNGKIDRKHLREQFRPEPAAQ